MVDTVDPAPPLSPADEAKKREKAPPAGDPKNREKAAPAGEAKEPDGAAPTGEAEELRDARSPGNEESEDEAEEPKDDRSLTELLEQLGSALSELAKSEAQLESARNLPEVRRAVREIVRTLVAAVAGLTAFAFFNVAVMKALAKVLASWLAALVVAAIWAAVGGMLSLPLLGRAGRWLLWIFLKTPPGAAMEDLERERDAAAKTARDTLEHLGPVLAAQLAQAAIPDAGDVAGGVVEVGDTVLETSDEIVEVITEQVPGGGVVNQVWSVALMPGRLGIKVATTVLRRGSPP
jgi:Putative Actinobacterial Holin-X, holin superfamily III